jgi:SNF2 family DNA or RNA helicase
MISIAPLGAGPIWTIRSSAYSPALHKEAKATPGLRWNPTERSWIGPADAVHACALRLEARAIRFDGFDQLRDAYFKRATPSLSSGWAKQLRDYQKEGVRFLVAQAEDGALLADDLGLGKTSQSLRAIYALHKEGRVQRAIVVCPSFVRGVWQKEIKKWLPSAALIELAGVKACPVVVPAHSGPIIIALHYDIAHAWARELIATGPDLIIFDECQFLMSDRSRRSTACREIARACKYRVGLSATPMTNRPRDLWNPIDTLREGSFGRPFDFYLSYCDAHKETIKTREGDRVVWNMSGASNLEELQARLNYFMLRRTKSDVALELPPRTRQIVEVEIPRKGQVRIDEAMRSDRALREALSMAADGKLPKALELITNHVETGSKVIVFTHRIVVAEHLAAALIDLEIDAKVITGDVSQKRRLAIVEEKPAVICATLDSTSVGIDLSHADVAVFVELDWVPSKLVQGEGRLHRFGQTRPVLIQYVIALSTIDEVIRDAVLNKLETFEKAVGRLDDGLKKSLAGAEVNSAQQLRKLYEKIASMEDV